MLVVEHEQFMEFIKLAKRLPLFGYNDPRDTAAETKANKTKKNNNKHFSHTAKEIFSSPFHSHFSGWWAARQTLGKIYDNEPTTVSGHNINNKWGKSAKGRLVGVARA